jgi:hypothetical protein
MTESFHVSGISFAFAIPLRLLPRKCVQFLSWERACPENKNGIRSKKQKRIVDLQVI